MTILECLSCGHKFSGNEVELTNTDISNKIQNNLELSEMHTEGLTTFINNKNEDMR